ncbi:class IIb bacteriocin, lactobin A/cerein 7B family [Lacihabitans lacunae]|uniref:Class IIb bacteriocin, lactobin A/cerein 7B family n=1 Tax=Lacihabitans lacunae TaxID=1028214 RepID=A0ABV7Z0H9_9BACT
MEITQEQTMFAEVVQKAMEDDAFKKTLIANPVNTIETFIGHELIIPNGLTLVVQDQSEESTIYLNIPKKGRIDELELTDEQLEMVAGGSTPWCLYAGYFVVCAAMVGAGVTVGKGIGEALR